MDEARSISDGVPYESLAPNRRHRFSYRVTRESDGTALEFPVNVVEGEDDGPRVVCVAGIHGDEPEGVATLCRLWETLDPDTIAGTVVLVPAANPPAFRSRTRRNPDDGLDMNRVFPGDERGTPTEQLAHHLFSGVARGADLVVSMHSMGSESMAVPYVEYAADSPVSAASRRAAEAFGAGYIDPFEWPEGLFSRLCSREGIPTIEPELGGLGATTPELRSQYARAIRNVLSHAGCLAEPPADGGGRPPEENGTGAVRIDREKLRVTTGGVLRHDHELEDEVEEGDRLARVTDFGGAILEEVTAPADGIVGELRRTAAISPGERACMVFVPRS